MGKQMRSFSIRRNAICILVAATFPSTKHITSVNDIMSRNRPLVVPYPLIAQVTNLTGPPVFVKVRHDLLLCETIESGAATLEGTARIIVIWAKIFVNVRHDLLLDIIIEF
jgi:hypothetical protein